MPRNMSFQMTTEQYVNRTKTVTRRMGWLFAKAGDVCNGVEKCQGLKKGEKMNLLGQHRLVDVRREPLNAVTLEDVVKEGFPNMTVDQFIDFYCMGHKGCTPETVITRIEYEYI
jgi:hypothetical protein